MSVILRWYIVISLAPVSWAQHQQIRRIGWWWDAPSTASDPAVDALLSWVKENRGIVSTILMLCGPTTKYGPVSGNFSAACAKVIPELEALGVGSELWLGETDSNDMAHALMKDPEATVKVLAELGKEHGGIVGFNFDLEVSKSKSQDAILYAKFLADVRTGLDAADKMDNLQSKGSLGVALGQSSRWRVTADASCSKAGGGWAPIISNCSVLTAGADLVMNMETYNAASYAGWLQQLGPSVNDPSIPRAKLGVGLGCWVEKTSAASNHEPASRRRMQHVPAWSLTAESAVQRVCELMNRSVLEIDMFRIAPLKSWPEPFWPPQLRKFMAGGGCMPSPPPKTDCPANNWEPCDPGDCEGVKGCCTIAYASVTPAGCSDPSNHQQCAQQQCEHSHTPVHRWVPLDYRHHPYTCCPDNSTSHAHPTPTLPRHTIPVDPLCRGLAPGTYCVGPVIMPVTFPLNHTLLSCPNSSKSICPDGMYCGPSTGDPADKQRCRVL